MSEVMTPNRSRIVTRQELALVPTPAGTPTFRPVPHIELVEALTGRLQERGATIGRESLAVSANGMSLFGTLDLENGIEIPGLGRALGFHAANDKSLAIQIVAGARVMVCDNLSLSGLDRYSTPGEGAKAARLEIGRASCRERVYGPV